MNAIQNNKCPKCGNESFETVKHSWRDEVAAETYEMADAMLKAREQ